MCFSVGGAWCAEGGTTRAEGVGPSAAGGGAWWGLPLTEKNAGVCYVDFVL